MIIIDCQSGYDVLEKVARQFDDKKKIIAVIKDSHAVKQYVFSIGIHDYIVAPIIPAEFSIRIKSCFALVQTQIEMDCCSNLSPSEMFPVSEKNSEGVLSNNVKNKKSALVSRTCAYLLANISINISLDELSRLMMSNRNTLSFAFKNVLGVGVFTWLRKQRMRRAAMLLDGTKLNVQQISYEVGYNDPANFSTSFKNYFGLTPQRYRQKMTESKAISTDANA